MKVSENVIASYCDFCPLLKKTKSSTKCCLCGKDLCDNHVYPVGTLRQLDSPWSHAGMPDLQAGMPTPHAEDESDLKPPMYFELRPVCPECASQSLIRISQGIKRIEARGDLSAL
jgi:hypothetical protein